MGYNPAMRLAFLRKSHCDPIDIEDDSFSDGNAGRADTSLPEFREYEGTTSQGWTQFRMETLETALNALLQSLPGSSEKKPHLLIMREPSSLLVSWADIFSGPKAAPPPAKSSGSDETDAADVPAKPVMPAIILLSRQAPVGLPKALARYDLLDLEVFAANEMKEFRTWTGIAIAE